MTTPAQFTPTTFSIDAATQMGLLALTVADLERSTYFYTEIMGFKVLQRDASQAILGAGETPLLILQERAGAEPWPHDVQGYTGLYHFAILLPTRADLGRWVRHWLETGFPNPGQGDHLVSEALYLSDPDGNGIEIYRDRPREQWRHANGQIQMATGPVDIRGMIEDANREGQPWSGLPEGTRLGHMHLQVGDIAQAAAFYHDLLGFDIMARMPSALFISAGGYHHHLGMNTWHSAGAGPAPEGTAGLRFFTIDFANEEARAAVVERLEAAGVSTTKVDNLVTIQDPWQNTIVLQVGAASDEATARGLIAANKRS